MLVAASLVVSAGAGAATSSRAPAAPSLVLDHTLLCLTVNSGGVQEIEVRANAGFRQGGRWKTLPFAVVATGGVGSATNVLDDSLAWIAAGRYDHNANLSPTDGLVATNATRFGTWALNRRACRPATASVALSGKGLRAAAPGPLGVTYDCTTPRHVLVRVRAVVHAAPTRYREQGFEKTKTSLGEGQIGVRAQAGKLLAFASVSDSGRTRLLVASSCRED